MERQFEIPVKDIKKEISSELEKEGKEYIEPDTWKDFQRTLYEMGIETTDFTGGEG